MENCQTQGVAGNSRPGGPSKWLQQVAIASRKPAHLPQPDEAGQTPGPVPKVGRLMPKKPLRALNFVCRAPEASSVSLVGDFNQWDPAAHPMKQMPDRAWLLTVELTHGHHRYGFLVDGQLVLDPRAQGRTRNDKGEFVSLVPVS